MTEAQRLREEAKRCRRLAEAIADAKAASALVALANEYLDRAQRLERQETLSPPPTEQQPAQQQQQIQPKKDDE
jgi:hypothetical protein